MQERPMSWPGPVLAGFWFFCLKELRLFSSSSYILLSVGLWWHETDPNIKVQDVIVLVRTRGICNKM